MNLPRPDLPVIIQMSSGYVKSILIPDTYWYYINFVSKSAMKAYSRTDGSYYRITGYQRDLLYRTCKQLYKLVDSKG